MSVRSLPSILAFGLVVACSLPMDARAEVVARNLEYRQDATVLEGVLIYDNAVTAKRPGVLIAHEQGAASVIARTKAAQIARLGYVTLSVDLYGKGIVPKSREDTAAKLGWAGKDRKVIRARMSAALDALGKQTSVDSKRMAAIGYGYGGSAVLELARSGADLEGVVCLHGDLTAIGDDAKRIGASVLVILGADDPRIPPAQVAAFEEEMRRGGVDSQIMRMGGVVHDFTNPQAGRNLKSGEAYDADADKRAADLIRLFLTESFPVTLPKTVPPEKKVTALPAPKGIPEKALRMLKHVDDVGEAMNGYEGGRNFGNFEKRLPQTDDKGRRIRYREWDVNPLRPGVNRGAERLVTGSDGSAYYTDDHYDTFKKIR